VNSGCHRWPVDCGIPPLKRSPIARRERIQGSRLSFPMDTVASYLVSMGIIGFGAWIVFAAAKASSGPLIVWTIMGLMPVAVGSFSLFAEMRGGNDEY
jgi:hypothetical protein